MGQAENTLARITSLIGKETVFHAREPISEAVIRRFAATMGDFNPLYWDEDYAEKTQFHGIIAPPTLIFELAFYNLKAAIDEGGRSKELEQLSGVAGFQRVANEYEILQPVRPGDVITRTSKVTGVTEKDGKKGKWLFITYEVTYTNQRGELLGINRETNAAKA